MGVSVDSGVLIFFGNRFIPQSLFRRRETRGIAAYVNVDGTWIGTWLDEKPAVGAKIDIGVPVVVIESEDVTRGVLVVAERVADGFRQTAERN